MNCLHAWMCTFIFRTVLPSVILQFVFWHGEGASWKPEPGTRLGLGCRFLGLPTFPQLLWFQVTLLIRL